MRLLASAALLALLAAPAWADAPPSAADNAATPDGVSSLRVVRDKETGKLRAPTAEEAKAMAAAERAERKASGERPVVVRQHPGGMKSAVLPPEYLSTLKGERQPDGRLKMRHADPADEHASQAPHQLPTK